MLKESPSKKPSKRPICLKFRVSETERDLIAEKMTETKIQNCEAYIRKMVLDGYIIRIEWLELTKVTILLSNISNNLNQLTKKAHQTGSIHADEIFKMREEIQGLFPQFRKVLDQLCKLKFNGAAIGRHESGLERLR